jgi:hypothetical protein
VNNLHNVNLVEAACSEKTGFESFFIAENHHQSSFFSAWADNANTEKVTIKTYSLDDYFQQKDTYPDFIKMDIEGGAVYALKGCNDCFIKKRPVALIESHTGQEDNTIGSHMQQYSYDAYRVSTKKWVLNNNTDYKDPDGVWGTMILVPRELRNALNF